MRQHLKFIADMSIDLIHNRNMPTQDAIQILNAGISHSDYGRERHRTSCNLQITSPTPTNVVQGGAHGGAHGHLNCPTSYSMAVKQTLIQQQIWPETAVATMKRRLPPPETAMDAALAAKKARQAGLGSSKDPKSVSYAERLMTGLMPSAEAASMCACRPITLPSHPRSPSETPAPFAWTGFVCHAPYHHSTIASPISQRDSGPLRLDGLRVPCTVQVAGGGRVCSGPSESSMSVARLVN